MHEYFAPVNVATLEPATPDSATYKKGEARARVEAFQMKAEYQAFLQNKEVISSLSRSLVSKSLQERIGFFESLETKAVRRRIADFEAIRVYKTFLAEIAIMGM